MTIQQDSLLLCFSSSSRVNMVTGYLLLETMLPRGFLKQRALGLCLDPNSVGDQRNPDALDQHGYIRRSV